MAEYAELWLGLLPEQIQVWLVHREHAVIKTNL